MPYIPPNSDVVLCRGVPIDSDYKHTLYFDSVAAQNNYFFSKAFKQFHHVSYQRERRNVMTLETPSSELYGCNYLLFKNTSYSEKWFFAFVDLVEYVSDTVTDIYYTIDMMQTWMFQYTLKQCFVAREHSATDNLFENTKNESVGYGKLMCGVHGDVLKASEQLTMCAVLTTKPFTSGVGAEKPLEIYNRYLLNTGNPDNYFFEYSCSVGQNMKRGLVIPKGTATGRYKLTVTVYNDSLDVVCSKQVYLNVHGKGEPLSSPVKLLCIGDSITNDKPWLKELDTLSKNLYGGKGQKYLL